MRKLLMLGLLLWGTAGGADMARPSLVAWERLLIATGGYEQPCPFKVAKPVRCGVFDVSFTVFRDLVALRPQFVQIQAWRKKPNDVYTARYKIGTKICLLVATPIGRNQVVATFGEGK